jgi:prefoldin subunit 5
VRGGSAVEALAADLRSLQRNVESLTATVDELRREQTRLSQRQLDDLDAIRAAVAAATDDLVARINAIDERTRSVT